MSLFLVVFIAGLAGMALLAVPGFGRLGHHAGGHIPHAHVGHPAHVAHPGPHAAHVQQDNRLSNAFRFIPAPRVVFTMATLFGAFGYALQSGLAWKVVPAAITAALGAILLERMVATPLWNLMSRFEGKPTSPLTDALMTEAVAVTEFHNGKGVVRLVHDGRSIQLSASLNPAEKASVVSVGDTLRIVDVEPGKEHVTVTLL
ncbi:MAG: hypothetical protein KGJ62_02630 [Armatimonadetes bacterium]|nr:hypothetical protein [Armatimonadota bacterium]MDE2205284.1 hypothetical protein [Armatimonadota bacterium]